MALSLALRVGLPILRSNVCWTSVLWVGQQVCTFAVPLALSNHKAPVELKNALEELDLPVYISVISELIKDSLPEISGEESWILSENERSSEQQLAQHVYEILDEIRCLLKIITDRISAYDATWFAIRSLNLDSEISQLQRKKRIFDGRCKLLWKVFQLKSTKTTNNVKVVSTGTVGALCYDSDDE